MPRLAEEAPLAWRWAVASAPSFFPFLFSPPFFFFFVEEAEEV